MKTTLHNFHIAGIASAVPTQRFDLTALGDQFGREEVERIIKGTGIREVRVAPNDICTSDLCQAAAEQLFAELNLQAADFDGLVFVSQTPDWIMPPTSPALQARLGMANDIVAFDINYGCSGFIYGIFQAALLIQTGTCNRLLVCAGDTNSKLINPHDKQVRMVFGDAAGVAVIEKQEGTAWPFVIGTDGSRGGALKIPAGGCRYPRADSSAVTRKDEHGNTRSDEDLFMDGMEIMNFSLREVPPAIAELLEMRRWKQDEVGVYALHQANKFMVDYLRRKMRLSPEAVPLGVENFGNTGPASIPLLLTVKNNELAASRDLSKTVLCGFGVGLSWAATGGDLSKTIFPKLVEIP